VPLLAAAAEGMWRKGAEKRERGKILRWSECKGWWYRRRRGFGSWKKKKKLDLIDFDSFRVTGACDEAELRNVCT
jgi:hypothetical protein